MNETSVERPPLVAPSGNQEGGQPSRSTHIPLVGTRLFEGHQRSRLAVGVVAYGDHTVPGLAGEHAAYGLLRGNIYAGEKSYMPADDLNADGSESDSDDGRSVHFAVFENAGDVCRAVGAMRLIIKVGASDRPLPVEHHYPKAFSGNGAIAAGVEVSRLIARHESKKIQDAIKWALYAAGTVYVLQQQVGCIYGAVEPDFVERLTREGIPVVALHEPVFVSEFNAVKLPVRVNIGGVEERLEGDWPGLLDDARRADCEFVYSGSTADG